MTAKWDELLNTIIEKEIELINTGESSLTPEEYKALLIKEYKSMLTEPREVKEQDVLLTAREMKQLTDDEGNVVYNTKTGLPIEIPTGNLVEQFPLTVIQQVRGLGEYYLHDVEGNDDKLTITWGCGESKEITINNVANATTASKLGTATVGSGVNHIYLNAGTPTASNSNVGGTAQPMFLDSGTMTACSASVGSADTPVYMDNGTLKACSGNVGGGGSIGFGLLPATSGTANITLLAGGDGFSATTGQCVILYSTGSHTSNTRFGTAQYFNINNTGAFRNAIPSDREEIAATDALLYVFYNNSWIPVTAFQYNTAVNDGGGE